MAAAESLPLVPVPVARDWSTATQRRFACRSLPRLLWECCKATRSETCFCCGHDVDEDHEAALHAFHEINMRFDGVEQISWRPTVLLVHDLFSAAECDRLRRKASGRLKRSNTYDAEGDLGFRSEYRTSSAALCTQREAPTLVRRLTKLLRCSASQLQTLSLVRYERGQRFAEHTDVGASGRLSRPDTGFVDSTRLVAVIPPGDSCYSRVSARTIYLNSPRRGGRTHFPLLGLSVRPCKGMALLHFPATLGCEQDPLTLHAGLEAVDEKWICVTWMWKDARAEGVEERLPQLSSERI